MGRLPESGKWGGTEGVWRCSLCVLQRTALDGTREVEVVRLRISACASPARRRNVSASSLPCRGWTPRPGTLIVYAPMVSATMPIPSCIISAGLSRAAQSGSEVRIMFPGREDIGRKRRCPQKRCVDGVDVRTGSIGTANAIARRIDLMHVLQSCRAGPRWPDGFVRGAQA